MVLSPITSDSLVAFDKPYSLPYAASGKSEMQIDRLLPDLKARVAPKSENLWVVKTVDKQVSGVLLFAKYVYLDLFVFQCV